MAIPLSDHQKSRLKNLEPKLDRAIKEQNFVFAQEIVANIQSLLRPTEHYVRMIQAKNKLAELAIELNKCEYALRLLKSNSIVVSKNTRIYLETISLIAVCYLRMKEIELAKEYIQLVLKNKSVIKTEKTRKIFHSAIINRFNEEIALATLTGAEDVFMSEKEIELESIRIIQTLSDDEIFSTIGQLAPNSTKDLIYLVHDFSVKQLPYSERLALPSPEQKIKDREVGITVFQSVKRVLYNSLCNPESDIYKAWYNNGMQLLLDKKYIISSVVGCLTNIGFGASMIAASIVALVSKFGIEIYCTKYKPAYIHEIRDM